MMIPKKLQSEYLQFMIGCVMLMFCGSANAGTVQLLGGDSPSAPIVTSMPVSLPELKDAERRKLGAAELEKRRQAEIHAQVVADLVYHLEAMTGRKPAVLVTDDIAAVPTPAIVLGDLAQKLGAEPQYKTAMGESFRLLTRDGRVLIGGESIYGVAHGIYELLRELGCDWIFPGREGEVIPRCETIVVGQLDRAKKPAFEVRAPWYSGGTKIVTAAEVAEFNQWKIRQQQTQSQYRQHPTFMGGGHYWGELLKRYKDILEKNPEMRALTRKPDGSLERTWQQLEPMNPQVVDLVVQDIRDMFKNNGWPNDYAVSLSIGPNDGPGYSVSPESLAGGAGRFEPITGDLDQTDVMVLYTNRVLERLEKEFPNLYLGWYLYSVHGDYPMRYQPHPHLTINIADITYSRFHSLLDTRSPTRNYYRNVLEQWGSLHKKQGNPMSFYGYNWNLAENLMPYSKLKIWGQDLPYYQRLGVIGHNNEQDKAWSILGPHDYLMARLGWDIDLDWHEVLKTYCRLAFGAGGPFMEQYYLNLIETQEAAGYEAGGYGAIHLIFTRDFIKTSRELFAKAATAAATDFHRRNVDYFSQPVTALELYLNFHEAITGFDFVRGKAAYEAMIAHWDKYSEKNSHLVSRYGRRYMETWLFKPFIEQAHKYSSGAYQLLYAIPDELPTILDPHLSGQFMGFYRPELRETGWMKTKTWSSTWEAQGLGPYRQGAVWYRISFDLPKTAAGADGIGLFVGAVEDEVNVWCNGTYIGRGRGFIRPLVFDLTGQVRSGDKNLVVIQVIRNGMLNELWRGGLMYPSFIFSGPRLAAIAPQTEPLYRILPGGSRELIKP